MAEWNSKANDVFLRAAEVESPTERLRFLDQECNSDVRLRAQVESLLAASQKVGSFLNEPAVQAGPGSRGTASYEPLAERPGTMVGPYKLLQQIGEGGMGVVYMAEQDQPVRRKVALKIIKPGMDSKQVVARFEAERQALAMMDHANIARVFDAGTTASGRPYFVMELVHGVPITAYCDANKLSPRRRLELFVPICHAVQHAHQKGIIHRDVKPSNILVTMYDDKPVPKVIDFGVAKAVEQRLTEKTLFTQYGTLVGTFEYMSPEQAEMNAFGVDTRSDIYSLGVLLYELLTGTTPLERRRLKTAAFDEIRRLIKEEEPQRPSVRLSTSGTLAKLAAARQTDPAKLSKLVRGELDWVVMKCLEKDRTRRYETANGLARDVEHYLRDEPVEACPPTIGYRLRKAYRKHKKPVALVAAFGFLLLVGLALVTWKWQAERIARTDADIARQDAETKAKEIQELADRMNAANAAMDHGDHHANFNLWASADAAYTKATELRKDHSSVWMRRARFYAGLGLWDLVTADWQAAFALREADSSLDWFIHALLLLESGDVDGYRRVCGRMRNRFDDSSDRLAHWNLINTVSLTADGAADWTGLVSVAQRLEQTYGMSAVPNYFIGTLYYRAGRFDDAIRYLRRSLADSSWAWRALNYPVLAMALQRQGHQDEARQELANARKALEGWTQESFTTRNKFVAVKYWWDWLWCQRFYREAHTLIEGTPPPEDPRLRIVRGRALAALGRMDQAATEYATAVSLPSADFTIRAESFRFFASAKRWSDAEAELAVLTKLKPNDPQVHLEAFRAFANSGNWSRAQKEHAAAMRLRPDDVSIRLERFRYHVERAEVKEAEAAYTDTIKDRTNDIAFRIKCADFCATLKQWAKARDEYLCILDAGTLGDGEINRDAWLRLAGLQLYLDDVDGYRRTCTRLVDKHEKADDFRYLIALIRICLLHPDPGVAPARIWAIGERLAAKGGNDPSQGVHGQVMVSLRLGKIDVDLVSLHSALSKHQWATQRIALARAYHARGDYHAARTWMNQVRAEFRRVDPAGVSYGQWDFNLEAQLWYRQAEAIIQSERWAAAFELIRQRQFAKAIDAFAPLLKADDNSGVDWGSRANCYAELGRWPEAAADYAHSLSLGRDYVPGFRNHCLAALQVGDKDTYLNLCRETLQRFADSTDRATLNTVAWLCALDPSAEAETGRALELIDKALRESQFNTYVHTRACLLYRAKRFDEALKQLDDLIARPGYAASAFDWLFLAMTCHQLGQTEKARENLDKSIAWMTANPQQDWQRRVELERFRAEAVALIGAKK